MQILVLGSGTILQKGTSYNCSGYLLDNFILFDCGPGIWRALHKHNINVTDIDNIFFSHFHVDHTSDLAPFLLERYINSDFSQHSLRIGGPSGLTEWFSKLQSLIGDWVREMKIDLVELDDKPYQVGDYKLFTSPTAHTNNSICYGVEKDRKKFFYSGDTDYNENVIHLAKSSDLAILEASNTEATHIEGHLTPVNAAKIASISKISKLMLTHMYPEVIAVEAQKTAAEYFKGEIIIAQDGMIKTF